MVPVVSASLAGKYSDNTYYLIDKGHTDMIQSSDNAQIMATFIYDMMIYGELSEPSAFQTESPCYGGN